MRPMLASPAERVPPGPEWSHEIKWDGMRILADLRGGSIRLTSRNEIDATSSFPELAGLADAHEDTLLDGEVVALDAGLPSFAALAERMHVGDPVRAAALATARPVTYLVFDVLRLYGVDLTSRPLDERRATLERLALAGAHWQVPPTYGDGDLLHAATLEQGLEGIVSKRRSSAYHPGRRSPDWRKLPHRRSRSVIVGGWRLEVDSEVRLGALLVGAPRPGGAGLTYLGRVGSGLAGARGQELLGTLGALTTDSSPFVDVVPRVDAKGAIWLRPELVVEVRSLGGTRGGRLRQPAYQGVRADLTAADLQDLQDRQDQPDVRDTDTDTPAGEG